MESQTRRQFGHQVLSSLLTYSLLETIFQADAFADPIQPVTARWLAGVQELSLDLKGGELSPTDWQERVENLFQQADLPDLLKFVELEKIKQVVQFRERGEKSFRPTFPRVEGLPRELVFGHQVFALKQGASVVPHGHNNMATGFIVLEGKFHGRHYDRLEDTETHMVIRPTIDGQFTPGGYSTISDVKDNVHWFKCTSERGYIFNLHVLSVKPGRSGRVYIDPQGEKLADGKIRARKLTTREAYDQFG